MPHTEEMKAEIEEALGMAREAYERLEEEAATAGEVVYHLQYLLDNPDADEQRELESWLDEAKWLS